MERNTIGIVFSNEGARRTQFRGANRDYDTVIRCSPPLIRLH
jgi:hypothetical protein